MKAMAMYEKRYGTGWNRLRFKPIAISTSPLQRCCRGLALFDRGDCLGMAFAVDTGCWSERRACFDWLGPDDNYFVANLRIDHH
jgi:hypothetical protein